MNKVITYGKSFLLWHSYDLLNFRLQELLAITKVFNINFEWLEDPSKDDPFYLINFSSAEDVTKIMSRSITIKSAYELWGRNKSLINLHSDLKSIPEKFTFPYYAKDASFRIAVETFGKRKNAEHKIQRINELSFLDFNGSIQLKNPDHSFLFMEYYGTDQNNAPNSPYRYFFGRWLADGQRSIVHKFNLRTRKFIGNTTMDPLLSLIMANFAAVKSGDIVLDPFAGTGGLLVAAAHFGGYVLGTDIDYIMLHGRAKPSRMNQKKRDQDESVYANMKQYGYESRYLDVIVSDSALPLWTKPGFFDAIITDPPYGIREAIERIGSDKSYKIPEDQAPSHIPSKVNYSLQNIMEDLLDFSSVFLALHGRLVYWMPSYSEDVDSNELPHHPCLKLLGCSKQTLSGNSSRFLITMEKIKENTNNSEKSCVPESVLSFRRKYFEKHKNQNN